MRMQSEFALSSVGKCRFQPISIQILKMRQCFPAFNPACLRMILQGQAPLSTSKQNLTHKAWSGTSVSSCFCGTSSPLRKVYLVRSSFIRRLCNAWKDKTLSACANRYHELLQDSRDMTDSVDELEMDLTSYWQVLYKCQVRLFVTK